MGTTVLQNENTERFHSHRFFRTIAVKLGSSVPASRSVCPVLHRLSSLHTRGFLYTDGASRHATIRLTSLLAVARNQQSILCLYFTQPTTTRRKLNDISVSTKYKSWPTDIPHNSLQEYRPLGNYQSPNMHIPLKCASACEILQ
jgi:hypothetical protein